MTPLKTGGKASCLYPQGAAAAWACPLPSVRLEWSSLEWKLRAVDGREQEAMQKAHSEYTSFRITGFSYISKLNWILKITWLEAGGRARSKSVFILDLGWEMTVCRPCEVEAFIWLQRTAGEITTVLRILIWAEFGGSQVSKKLKNGIQGSELVNPEIYSTQFGQEMAEQALLIYESKDSLLKCIALLYSQQCWDSFCPFFRVKKVISRPAAARARGWNSRPF